MIGAHVIHPPRKRTSDNPAAVDEIRKGFDHFTKKAKRTHLSEIVRPFEHFHPQAPK